jgi:hypothetical protein
MKQKPCFALLAAIAAMVAAEAIQTGPIPQISIPLVDRMVGVPEPLVPVDWQALAKTYVTTVFDAAAQVRRGVVQ